MPNVFYENIYGYIYTFVLFIRMKLGEGKTGNVMKIKNVASCWGDVRIRSIFGLKIWGKLISFKLH